MAGPQAIPISLIHILHPLAVVAYQAVTTPNAYILEEDALVVRLLFACHGRRYPYSRMTFARLATPVDYVTFFGLRCVAHWGSLTAARMSLRSSLVPQKGSTLMVHPYLPRVPWFPPLPFGRFLNSHAKLIELRRSRGPSLLLSPTNHLVFFREVSRRIVRAREAAGLAPGPLCEFDALVAGVSRLE